MYGTVSHIKLAEADANANANAHKIAQKIATESLTAKLALVWFPFNRSCDS